MPNLGAVTKNVSEGPSVESQIVPAVAGGVNSLLFGLPEAAIKAIGGEKTRQIVDAYKAQNPGYGVGENIGTGASLFIPGGAIARGASLGAKALGASKLAGGLEKVAKVAEGPLGLKQGLATAAEQAVPRAVSEQIDTGDIGQTATNLGANLALGAGVGKALKTVKNVAGKYIPPEPLKEINDAANDQILATVFGAPLGRAIRGVVGTKTGASGQIEKINDIKDQIVGVLQKHNIANGPAVEELLGENGKAWQEIGENVNKAIANKEMESIGSLPADMLAHPDIDNVIKMYGKDAEDAIEKIAGQVARTADNPANTFAVTRDILNKNIQLGIKGGEKETIQGEAATAMKNYFDQKAMDVAPNSPDIEKLKEIYPAFLAMGRAIARDKATVAPAFTPGSDTFMKFAVNATTDLGQAAANAGASVLGNAANKLAATGANIAGTEAAFAVKKAIPKLRELSDKTPQVVKDAAKGSVLAGAERIPGAVISAPGEPIPSVQPIPAYGMPPDQETSNVLDDRLALAWQLEDPTGAIEASQPGSRQAFMDGVKKNLTNKDGTINYLRAGKALFPDNPEDEKKFTESVVVLQRLKDSLAGASKFLSAFDPKAEADKNNVINTVAGAIKDSYPDEKAARSAVEQIINNPIVKDKEARIMYLLKNAAPDKFGETGVLKRAGVLP